MLQITQNIRDGRLSVVTVPEPLARPGHVLIANACSLISAGTEKMVMDLAGKSLLGKARERPDHVRRVLQKLRGEGILQTLAQVREKLDEPMAMGYCSSGIVLACGSGVQEFKPGDRVASNGPHAGVVCVPKNLCATVPDGVSFEQAAFTVLGAIALQGVRLARLSLGDTAFVIGLGLVGQLAVALLKAQGCRVLATDPDSAKCVLAATLGADPAAPHLDAGRVLRLTRGLGADAVLIAASTKSDGPVELAGEAVRQKGRVVAVGAVGLNLPRRPYYFKEAEFVVSCSYGPGRYDPEYEERGRDYPAAHVRWTEQRNMQAVLDLMASGRLDVRPLISHRFRIENAEAAYALIEAGMQPYLGIILEYPDKPAPLKRLTLPAVSGVRQQDSIGVGCLGAGNFARMVLLPAIAKDKRLQPRIICSAGGLSAAHSGLKSGFEAATADEDEVFKNDRVSAVFVVTRHDRHASQVIEGIRSGRHVFVEKPLALTVEELIAVEAALGEAVSAGSAPLLMVGFNRRFSPAARRVKEFFSAVHEPLTVMIRFNAGEIPAEHWTQDESTGGGRIIGEACHAIDLAACLAGAPPVRVFAESIGGLSSPRITDDQCFITLRHANGAISTVAYLSGGDKAFPKERVEVIGGGRIAVIEDFREVITCAGGKIAKTRLGRQDKGHRAEIEAFASAVADGGPWPIPWEELRAVSLAAILAVRSIREGVPFELDSAL
ncbi:bi-domain-containing oxidoreductase [Syntrophobacter fumaroxidans]|uniref:Alcohol dehydrogenase, zinc-binding domain protein n=1 Tax=Syntrophobacter fumaroxidans (strain DSM 10017 / MPOB) TaxID=335543 RepID=A0LNK2_SYNFM|nr:bi-domain-containing oxidoreductase [Syntrophobacter fumaroxidans]ABK19004.1 Alcohol dehydrogenase, zinc-binding domain protein [Syntrophobacter fumaroxidans MPOB]